MSNEKHSSGAILKRELYSLAKVAQKSGQSFTPDNPQQVLALLSWAIGQKDPEIIERLVRVGASLSSSHRMFFEKNGISFDVEVLQKAASTKKTYYRGVEVEREEHHSSTDSSPTKGKRKIVYRGQEKWV